MRRLLLGHCLGCKHPAVTDPDTAASRAKMPALYVAAAVVVVLLALRYVLKIDVWYVLTGGVPGVFAVETAVIGFVLGHRAVNSSAQALAPMKRSESHAHAAMREGCRWPNRGASRR